MGEVGVSKPTDALPGRTFAWHEIRQYTSGDTFYVCLTGWEKQPDDKQSMLRILILDSTYPYHSAGEVMRLFPNDRLWKEAKRIT